MTGANCCVVNCGRHRDKRKFPSVRFYQIPTRKKHTDWAKQLVAKVNRADRSFNPSKAFICSVHFKPECQYEGGGLFFYPVLPFGNVSISLHREIVITVRNKVKYDGVGCAISILLRDFDMLLVLIMA